MCGLCRIYKKLREGGGDERRAAKTCRGRQNNPRGTRAALFPNLQPKERLMPQKRGQGEGMANGHPPRRVF